MLVAWSWFTLLQSHPTQLQMLGSAALTSYTGSHKILAFVSVKCLVWRIHPSPTFSKETALFLNPQRYWGIALAKTSMDCSPDPLFFGQYYLALNSLFSSYNYNLKCNYKYSSQSQIYCDSRNVDKDWFHHSFLFCWWLGNNWTMGSLWRINKWPGDIWNGSLPDLQLP